jgi:hypothetical protein
MTYIMPGGVILRKSGSANVVEPLPPNRVPNNEKRAEFVEIGSNRPSHGSTSLVMNVNDTRKTCPKYASNGASLIYGCEGYKPSTQIKYIMFVGAVKFGSANVVVPLPPYVVPTIENNVEY